MSPHRISPDEINIAETRLEGDVALFELSNGAKARKRLKHHSVEFRFPEYLFSLEPMKTEIHPYMEASRVGSGIDHINVYRGDNEIGYLQDRTSLRPDDSEAYVELKEIGNGIPLTQETFSEILKYTMTLGQALSRESPDIDDFELSVAAFYIGRITAMLSGAAIKLRQRNYNINIEKPLF